MQFINHDSFKVQQALCEPAMASQPLNEIFQFERLGYYCVNQLDEQGKVSAFHRVVDLKDTWGNGV